MGLPPEISFAVDGHVATLTLNRPQKLNAVTPEMSAAIIQLAGVAPERMV